MWYENVDLMPLTDYKDWDVGFSKTQNEIKYDIRKFYPDMFELDNIYTPSYSLKYEDVDYYINCNDPNSIYLLEFNLYFLLPYLPENMPEAWLDNDVKCIFGEIIFDYPEFVEIYYISSKKTLRCTVDIKKDLEGKYVLHISGDIEGKVVSKERPFVYFRLDISNKLMKFQEEYKKEEMKIKQKYKEKMENATEEEKKKLEKEIDMEMGYNEEERQKLLKELNLKEYDI